MIYTASNDEPSNCNITDNTYNERVYNVKKYLKLKSSYLCK